MYCKMGSVWIFILVCGLSLNEYGQPHNPLADLHLKSLMGALYLKKQKRVLFILFSLELSVETENQDKACQILGISCMHVTNTATDL